MAENAPARACAASFSPRRPAASIIFGNTTRRFPPFLRNHPISPAVARFTSSPSRSFDRSLPPWSMRTTTGVGGRNRSEPGWGDALDHEDRLDKQGLFRHIPDPEEGRVARVRCQQTPHGGKHHRMIPGDENQLFAGKRHFAVEGDRYPALRQTRERFRIEEILRPEQELALAQVFHRDTEVVDEPEKVFLQLPVIVDLLDRQPQPLSLLRVVGADLEQVIPSGFELLVDLGGGGAGARNEALEFRFPISSGH